MLCRPVSDVSGRRQNIASSAGQLGDVPGEKARHLGLIGFVWCVSVRMILPDAVSTNTIDLSSAEVTSPDADASTLPSGENTRQ